MFEQLGTIHPLLPPAVGLAVLLGAGAGCSGINPEEEDCGVCECTLDGSRPICLQGADPGSVACNEACSPSKNTRSTIRDTQCSQVPGCPQFGSTNSAPTASPYGIAALLIALGGFGAWRLRKRAAA